MSTKSFATELQETIRSIRDDKKISEIKCDNLLAYLDEVINSPDDEVNPDQMEKYKAELQMWVAQNKAAQESNLEMFRSVILSGQNALRTAFFMNGGATVALLAFLGKLASDHQDKIKLFSSSLLIFVFGVFFIGLASGFTYLSQWFYAADKTWYKKAGLVLNIIVILLGLASYTFFIWGAIKAYFGFINFV